MKEESLLIKSVLLSKTNNVVVAGTIVHHVREAQGCLLKQVHGSRGWRRTRENCRDVLEGDWHFTYEENTPLVVCVADCTAVLLAGENASGSFVAALHAGWRGTADHIIEKSLDVLKPLHGTVTAWLSPSICQNHFEVGPEVLDALGCETTQYARPGLGDRARPDTSDRHFLDLRSLQKSRLKNFDIAITEDSRCTYCDPALVSYRRDGPQLLRRMAYSVTRIPVTSAAGLHDLP